MAKKSTRFVCQTCGQSAPKWQGQCSGCGEWNTIVEEALPAAGRPGSHTFASGNANLAMCKTLAEIEKAVDRDTWLDADEAKEFGLVDKVFESRPDADHDASGTGGAPE